MKKLSIKLRKSFVLKISKLLLLFSLPFLTLASNSSSATVSGVIIGNVIDSEDSTEIPYATIALYSDADNSLVTGTITCDDGEFFLEGISEGEYYIEINFLGYNKQIVEDIVISDKKNRQYLEPVNLIKAYETLTEVEISAERSALEYRLDRRIVNIDRNLQSAGGTVVEALENLPSIQTDAEGNIMLRGSSSFTVLIDGRPSSLSGSDALRQIPAGAVEQVEVITNPSAKYDPDGSSGIINVIMKKDYQDGFNGLINASAGTARKRSGDFSFNYRKDKLNYFFSGRYAERPRITSAEVWNKTIFDDNTRVVHQFNDRFENSDPYAVSGGLDYHINDRNVLSFTGEYGYLGFAQEMDSDVIETLENSNIFKSSYADLGLNGNYINGVLNFDHNSEKDSKWSNSLFLSTWDGGFSSLVKETLLDSPDGQELFTDSNWSKINTNNIEFRAKSDYSKSFNENSNIEAGYQYRLKDENGVFRYYNFIENDDEWLEDMKLHSDMYYLRHIHSLYGTYSGEFVGFEYQGGLRAEYTDRSLTVDKDYVYQKIDFFPTVHLTRTLPNNQRLQAGYSRRINRPESRFLNPSVTYSDSYMYQKGTPDLLPEITDSYELNYIRFINIGFVSGEAYYRKNQNSFAQDLTTQQDGRIRTSFINVGNSYSYGVELSSNLTFSEYFNSFISTNIYNYSIDSDLINENVDSEALRYNFNINANIMATESTRFQITGIYQSPSITHQGRTGGLYGVNLALNQEFFNNQLAATLSVRDVFKTMVYKFEAHDKTGSTDFTYNMEQQVVMFSIRYTINNFQNNRKREEIAPQGGGLF